MWGRRQAESLGSEEGSPASEGPWGLPGRTEKCPGREVFIKGVVSSHVTFPPHKVLARICVCCVKSIFPGPLHMQYQFLASLSSCFRGSPAPTCHPGRLEMTTHEARSFSQCDAASLGACPTRCIVGRGWRAGARQPGLKSWTTVFGSGGE